MKRERSQLATLATLAVLVAVVAVAYACGSSSPAAPSPIPVETADAGGEAGPAAEAGDEEGNEGTFDGDDASVPEPDAAGADGGCNQADIEANDTPATARPLAATTDCDDKGNKIKGTLASAADVDWFSFHGSDTPTCVVNPTATVSETGLRVCVYVKCDSGQGSVPTCAQGTKDPSPPSGLDGCCANTLMFD